MRSLGLRTSLTCDGVLQAARSIESVLQRSMSSLPRVRGNSADDNSRSSNHATEDEAAAAREAAVIRSRQLLRFVDRNADKLLVASEESGRWFVQAPMRALSLPAAAGPGSSERSRGYGSGLSQRGTSHGGFGIKGGVGGARLDSVDDIRVSSGTESDETHSDYDDEDDGEELSGLEEDEEERAHRREMERTESLERRERARAREALAALTPPPNQFVEELNKIAWLPVHAAPINPLMPWKVRVRRSNSRVGVLAFLRRERCRQRSAGILT